STSGVGQAELAAGRPLAPRYHYTQQELGSPARFLTTALKVRGPSTVISTACSSSAKAMATAARWLNAG
ncbi:MAG TPA: beta-ketoacyl synthase N-terminal-like domain-containing protein, partial [Archangium sp.]